MANGPFDYNKLFHIPPGGFVIAAFLRELFHPTTGHNHDGVNSVALLGGSVDDVTLAESGGVFSVKAKGISSAKLADDVQVGSLASLDTTAKTSVVAALNEIFALVTGAGVNPLTYKGALDCAANPNYPAADAGDVYIISVAGKVGGASGTVVEAGDMIICKTDGTTSGTQAAKGAAWNIVQTNLDLSAVADGVSGADQIGMTAITETGANATVQSVIEALVTRLKAIADGLSGADLVGMTAITETGAAATVQSVIEALVTALKAVTDSASGADLVGMTVITETGAAATVQSVIEALIARLKAVTDSASGADLIAMTALTETGAAATVQSVIEALVTALKAVTDSSSGADLVGATAITAFGAPTTVQGILEAIPTKAVMGAADGIKHARSDGMVAVTGTLDVDTGLAAVKSCTASLAEAAAATGAFVSCVPGAAGHITISVYKGDYSAADAAKNVFWMADGT